MALADMLNAPQDEAAQADPNQAMAELDAMIEIVSNIKDEASYRAVVQKYMEMGGDASDLSDYYDPQEVQQMLEMLLQAKQELAAQL